MESKFFLLQTWVLAFFLCFLVSILFSKLLWACYAKDYVSLLKQIPQNFVLMSDDEINNYFTSFKKHVLPNLKVKLHWTIIKSNPFGNLRFSQRFIFRGCLRKTAQTDLFESIWNKIICVCRIFYLKAPVKLDGRHFYVVLSLLLSIILFACVTAMNDIK